MVMIYLILLLGMKHYLYALDNALLAGTYELYTIAQIYIYLNLLIAHYNIYSYIYIIMSVLTFISNTLFCGNFQ